MTENFDSAFSLTIAFEGGDKVTNDPNDPGGLTKWGISKRANPDLDIENLTKEQAKDIYRKRYWEQAGCDLLPYPIDVFVFDSAVNMGVLRAKKMVEDAGWDPTRYLLKRIDRYIEICNANQKMKQYFFGWTSRVLKLFKILG